MSLNVPCPFCDLLVELPNEYLSATIRCPRCDAVFPVQRTGVTDEAPIAPSGEPLRDFASRISIEALRLPRSRRYEPGRGRLLLALGVSSLAVSLAGMVVGSFLCAAPVLFGPLAFLLGLQAWIKGQRDMEKIHFAIIDPYAEKTTRIGWVCGITGAILGVLLTLSGLCGAYLLLTDWIATANSVGAAH